jgi:hypothetical protein
METTEMNAGGWTPGPWTTNAIARGRIIGDASTPGAEKIQINNSNSTVATVYRPKDAHLVAAAPDMAAVLEKLVRGFETDDMHNPDTWEAARAALAKARKGGGK